MSSAFTLTVDSQGIGTLVFDLPNEKVNKFSMPVMEELEKIVDSLKSRTDIKVLLIKSGKPDIFIAGADLHGFGPAFKDPPLLEKLIRQGHRTFNKIEQLPFPTIAVINGVCLGGGLEFALACNYRIVTDNPKTSLGLPEVTLGIFPGWGGTQRLPKLIGLTEGLGMILSGKPVNAFKAWKLHLADAIVPWQFQDEKVPEFVSLILTENGKKKVLSKRQRSGILPFLLEKNPLGRAFVFHQAKKDVLSKTKGHYIAPLVALDLIKDTYGKSQPEGLEKEISTILTHSKKSSGQAQNLIDLFFVQESLKKDPGVKTTAPLLPVKSVAVLGAGTMGAGIAWLLTNNNYPVRLKDINWEVLGKGFGHVSSLFYKGVKNKKLKPSESSLKFQLLSGTVDYSGFKNVDLVIEAAVENIELKNKIFHELEGVVRPNAIIATNTSSLTIEAMSKAFAHPERFLGMHFFNPVNKMPLVEVVGSTKTSPEVIATAVEFCKKIGKTPIVVGDCAGFLVNRIFVAGANEVMWMFQEGVPMKQLEKAMLDFGMPMSPFELSDEVGNDVSYKVSKALETAYGERMHCPEILHEVYERKLFGKKIDKGFYIYKGKDKKPNPEINKILSIFCPKNPELTDSMIQDRMILSMVNEAARCLQEKIIGSPAYLDMAMILGTGFPPFRGGLLKYADELGIEYVVTELKNFERLYGPRFAPAQLLLDMQKSGGKFYSMPSKQTQEQSSRPLAKASASTLG